MGCCFSTVSDTDAVNAPPTAKVITPAGALREYSHPVTVSAALDADGAGCFLCSSDKIYCGDYLPAMDPEEPLQLGQLYFVLLDAKRRFPLSPADMAALAVKASAALEAAAGRGGGGGRRKRIRIMPVPEMESDHVDGGGEVKMFDGELDPRTLRPVGSVQRKVMRRSGSVRARVVHRYRSFRNKLSTIPEIVE